MSETAQRGYHHGNLRITLIGAALEMLETVGTEDISLRALAASAGVSRAAPYAHFADKRALLSAIAEAGFEKMAGEMHDAMERASGAHARFLAVGRAYVRFAASNPNLFKLMFGADADGEGKVQPQPARGRPYEYLQTSLHAYLEERGVAALDESVVRTAAWSCVHGLSLLLLGGRLPALEEQRDAVIDDVTSLFAGLLGAGGSAGEC